MNTITVITICFNNIDELSDTCLSVDRQLTKPFEHLIIDGSTNETIKNYLEQNPQPPYRRWICERDNGISDAFNKGVINAKGNITVMLNSGDIFFDETALETALAAFDKDTALQWLHAKYKMLRGNIWVILGKPFEKKKMYRGMRSICHQTMFVKKELHDKYGLYDNDLKIAMDYDFLLRIANEKFIFLEDILVQFAPLGISSSSYLNSLEENKKSYLKYYGKSILLTLWQGRLKILYYLLNTTAGKKLYQLKVRLKLENA
ncbi:MAG TPA: glycosyltransferase [Panacibacter sp.]|nr:glycosyltransferase [Panacibacter sp.]